MWWSVLCGACDPPRISYAAVCTAVIVLKGNPREAAATLMVPFLAYHCLLILYNLIQTSHLSGGKACMAVQSSCMQSTCCRMFQQFQRLRVLVNRVLWLSSAKHTLAQKSPCPGVLHKGHIMQSTHSTECTPPLPGRPMLACGIRG